MRNRAPLGKATTILPARFGQSTAARSTPADPSPRSARRSRWPDRPRARRRSSACARHRAVMELHRTLSRPRSPTTPLRSQIHQRPLLGATPQLALSRMPGLRCIIGGRRASAQFADQIALCRFQCHGWKTPIFIGLLQGALCASLITVIVALSNKLARIVSALLPKGGVHGAPVAAG